MLEISGWQGDCSSDTFFDAGDSRLLGMGGNRGIISWGVLRRPILVKYR